MTACGWCGKEHPQEPRPGYRLVHGVFGCHEEPRTPESDALIEAVKAWIDGHGVPEPPDLSDAHAID